MLNNSKLYRASKKEYYINLRSNDAQITQTAGGNSLMYAWNLNKPINTSGRAKIGVVGYYATGIPANQLPFLVIRCPQVQNLNVFDSSGSASTIIYLNSTSQNVVNQEFHPLSTQNLNRIELYVSNSITDLLNGIHPDIRFYIQFKIFDYDDEEVDEELMPRYTSKSLAYHTPSLNIF